MTHLRHDELLILGTLVSVDRWRGRSTAGPFHQQKAVADRRRQFSAVELVLISDRSEDTAQGR